MISTLRLQQSPLVPPSPPFSLCPCWPTTRLLIKRNNAVPAPPPPCLLLTYFSWIGDNDNFRTFLGWQGGLQRGGYGAGCQVVVLPRAARTSWGALRLTQVNEFRAFAPSKCHHRVHLIPSKFPTSPLSLYLSLSFLL